MKKVLFFSGSISLLVVCIVLSGCSNRWSAPESYRSMKSPLENSNEDLRKGKELYEMHCSTCHGKGGRGDGLKSAALTQSPGDFSKPGFQKQRDGEHFYKTKTGRGEMPGYARVISDDDIWAVVVYMRTFKK